MRVTDEWRHTHKTNKIKKKSANQTIQRATIGLERWSGRKNFNSLCRTAFLSSVQGLLVERSVVNSVHLAQRMCAVLCVMEK